MRKDEARARLVEQLLGEIEAVGLDERLARLETHRLVERARHRPADEQRVDLGQQRLDDVDLAGDLRAAEDRDERPLRVLEGAVEVVDLLLHQQARDRRRQVLGHAFGGRVGAVRGPERVVHVQIAELRQRT